MTNQANTCVHQTGSLWRTLGGWTCLLIGVLGLVLPFIPGIPLLIIGMVALSPNYLWARTSLKWIRERIRRGACPPVADIGHNNDARQTHRRRLSMYATENLP